MRRKRRNTYEIYARKNWIARNKVLLICIASFIVLAAAAVVLYFTVVREPEEYVVKYEAMTPPSLPTLTMNYKGLKVNKLHGYTQEIDAHYIRRNLYSLEDTYEIPIEAELYGTQVTSVNFKVLDTENNSLVQNGSVDEFDQNNDRLNCTLQIDNLIEDGIEYVLDVILHDKKGRDIHYYTRLKKSAETALEAEIGKALEFNEATFNGADDSVKAYLVSLLDTKWWIDDNSDLGEVSLFSSLSNVTWGAMKVTRLGVPEIEILDIDGEIGYIRLNFTVTREENSKPEYYRASEFYRLRRSGEKIYILNYERTADQAFDPEAEEVIAVDSAKLGIISSQIVERKCDKQGAYSCFIADGTLWAMDSEKKTLKEIFTFSTGVNDDRGNYAQHAMKIINVDSDGSIQFVVYGYMNAGLHEGKVGIGMYTYHADTQIVEEEIFIPSILPYEMLKTSIGNLFYLSSTENALYIMMDKYLYRLDLEKDRAELVTGGLNGDNYVLHTSGKIIAWNNEARVNDAESISVLNMETGKRYEVKADAGTSIKVLGFLNEELVYGKGKSGNIYEEQSGKQYLLMTDMYVINDRHQILEEDSAGDGYFIDSINEYNRVVLTKVVSAGDTYEEAEDFTIFATEAEAYSTSLECFTTFEEAKKTVFYVGFAQNTTTAGELAINRSAVVMFTDAKTIDVQDMLESNESRYYVYAKGEVKDIEENAAHAVKLAYDECGVVLKQDGSLFYKRGVYPSSVELSSVTINRSIECIKAGEMINVTGITLTQAMYFTGNKKAVFWEKDGKTYLFTGYDYKDNLFMYDIDAGTEEYIPMYDFEDTFPTTGHVYVVE